MVRRSCLLPLLCILVAAAPYVDAQGQDDGAYYFFLMKGKAAFLWQVSLNGNKVIEGTLISIELPLPVTKYVREGTNTLDILYTSDAQEGLTLIIERRRKGSSAREEVLRFTSRAGETEGKKARKLINFPLDGTTVVDGLSGSAESPAEAAPAVRAEAAKRSRPKVWTDEDMAELRYRSTISTVGTTSAPAAGTRPAAAEPLQSLSEADKQAMLSLLRAYHQALSSKDLGAVTRFYDPALQEAAQVYPEGVKLFQDLVLPSFRQLLASPEFRMMPLRTEGLVFSTEGDKAVVSRADGSPVVESPEVKIELPPELVPRPGRVTKSTGRIAAEKVHFKKYSGQWQFALPF